jgi:hypothetical protein
MRLRKAGMSVVRIAVVYSILLAVKLSGMFPGALQGPLGDRTLLAIAGGLFLLAGGLLALGLRSREQGR